MSENINFPLKDADLNSSFGPIPVDSQVSQPAYTDSMRKFSDDTNLVPTVEGLQSTEQVSENPIEKSTFAIQGEIPVLTTEVQNNSEREATRGFFGRRMDALSRISKKADSVLTSVFGYELADGVPITGRQALRARFSANKLAHNTKTNIGMFRGKQPQEYDRMKNNVLRDAVYAQAIQGNHHALQYVKSYDKNIGNTEQTATEAMFEAALVLSGAAAVRKVGLFAVMLVSLGGRSAARSMDKSHLADRFDKSLQWAYAKDQHEAGHQKYNQRATTYNAVATMAIQKGLSARQKKDPFSF
jgi:hypothetical protein